MGAAPVHEGRTRSVAHGGARGVAAGGPVRTERGLNPAQSGLLDLQRSAGNAAVTSLVQRVGGSAVTSTPAALAESRRTTASSDTITVAGTEGAAPFQSLKALHAQAGRNVVEMTTHEWKVERYTRYLEGDDLFVRQQRADLLNAMGDLEITRNQLAASASDPKKTKALQSQQAGVQKRIAAANAAFANEAPASDPKARAEAAVAAADNRLAAGLEAQSRTAAEKPVVGLAYDETKKHVARAEAADPSKLKGGSSSAVLEGLESKRMSAEISELFDEPAGPKAAPAGEGRFGRWRRERAERSASAEKKKSAAALDQDIAARRRAAEFPALVGQANKEATPLVQQSILSEQVVAVKRKQLKAMKATVAKVLSRGTTTAKHIGNKIVSGVAGAVLATATFGAVEVEGRKTQGGYKSERRFVTPWTKFKEDLASLRRIAETRKDGAFSTSYVVLKGFNELVVKQIRNIFGGLATTLGLLGLIPGLQPLLGVAAICAVVSLGAAATKLLVDTALTAWNAVATARNQDAYHERMLKGELVATGLDALGSALRVGGAVAGPLAANATLGAAGSSARVNDPFEMAKQVGGIHSGGDLGGVRSIESPVSMDDPLAYAGYQGMKTVGIGTSTASTISGQIAGAVSGTEGLGGGASARLEHDDRDQWRTVGSKADAARRQRRAVPSLGGGAGGGSRASRDAAAELEKEAAVKNAARSAQGRWAREQGLGLVGRIEELQAKVGAVADGTAGKAAVAAAKDGPEAAEDADGAAGVAQQAGGTLGAVAAVLKDGAQEAVAP